MFYWTGMALGLGLAAALHTAPLADAPAPRGKANISVHHKQPAKFKAPTCKLRACRGA